MTFMPEKYDGSSAAPRAPEPKKSATEQKWDDAVSFYKTRQNHDEYRRHTRDKFNRILEDERFSPTYEQLKNLFAEGNGEVDAFSGFSKRLIQRAARNGVDFTQNDGEFIVLLAEHGKRFSIGEALKTSNDWNTETIETALDIAVKGNKTGTTGSIAKHCPISHLPALCDVYFNYTNKDLSTTKIVQDETLERIGKAYDTIEKLYELKQNTGHNVHLFLTFYAENNLKSKWQKPNDQEASFNVDSHGISIMRLFNFKADHVQITTQGKSGLVSDIKTFNEYQGDDEIMEAYRFLSVASRNPPEAPKLKTRKPKIAPPSKSL